MTDIARIVNYKFDEFKKSLIDDFKEEVDKYFNNEQREKFNKYVLEKQTEIEKQVTNLELTDSIKEIQKHETRLNRENLELKEANKIFKSELDDIQQHDRCPNLRIYGVKVKENETNSDVEKVVRHILKDE